jgi:hypothetical protein
VIAAMTLISASAALSAAMLVAIGDRRVAGL